jgi:multimeric flavodoxin WrbA
MLLAASPHKDGYTARLAEAFLSAAEDSEIRRFDAFGLGLLYCDDCGGCRRTPGSCVKTDGMGEVYAAFEWAEVIVIATPVYFNGVPAPLKTLFDRCQCLYVKRFVHRIPCAGRKKIGVLLAASGSSDEESDHVRAQVRQVLSCAGASLYGTVFLLHTDTLSPDDMEDALQQTRALFASVSEKLRA